MDITQYFGKSPRSSTAAAPALHTPGAAAPAPVPTTTDALEVEHAAPVPGQDGSPAQAATPSAEPASAPAPLAPDAAAAAPEPPAPDTRATDIGDGDVAMGAAAGLAEGQQVAMREEKLEGSAEKEETEGSGALPMVPPTPASLKRKRDDEDDGEGEKAPGSEGEHARVGQDDGEYVPPEAQGADTAPPKKKKRRMTPEERAAWEEQRRQEKARKEAEERRKKEEREAEKKRKEEERKRREEEKAAEKRRKEEQRLAEKRRREEEHEAEKRRKEEERKRKEEEREAERKRKEEEREAEKKRREEERMKRQREAEEEKRRKESEAMAHTKRLTAFFAPTTPKAHKESVTVTSPLAPLPHAVALEGSSADGTSAGGGASFYRAIGPFKAEVRPPESILVDFRRPPLRDAAAFERLLLPAPPDVSEDASSTLATLVEAWRRVRSARASQCSVIAAQRERLRRAAYDRQGVVLDLSGASDREARRTETLLLRTRFKFLTHHDDARPPYRGTVTRLPVHVSSRRPWAKETDLDYEEDSGEEWEDEDDADASELGDDDERDEEEGGPNEYELDDDSMVVPDDYFSADEGIDAIASHDADDGDLAQNGDEDDEDEDPLLPNLKPRKNDKRAEKDGVLGRSTLSREKLLAKTKANLKRKAERGAAIQARCHGVSFALDALADDRERRLFASLCAVVVASVPGPVKTVAEPWQPRAKFPKGKKRAREEGQVEETPSKKRALEALAPDVERAILLTAHGTTGVEKVATELALKFVALTKKRVVRTIKEHSSYERREGGGLRKRYYVTPDAAARLGIEPAELDAAFKSALEREAHDPRLSATHAHQLTQAQCTKSAPQDVMASLASPSRRTLPVAPSPAPSFNSIADMMTVLTPQTPQAMTGVMGAGMPPIQPVSASESDAPVLQLNASLGVAPVAPPAPPQAPTLQHAPSPASPPSQKAASITSFFPLAKPAPDT